VVRCNWMVIGALLELAWQTDDPREASELVKQAADILALVAELSAPARECRKKMIWKVIRTKEGSTAGRPECLGPSRPRQRIARCATKAP
jgi:hypothetical protein